MESDAKKEEMIAKQNGRFAVNNEGMEAWDNIDVPWVKTREEVEDSEIYGCERKVRYGCEDYIKNIYKKDYSAPRLMVTYRGHEGLYLFFKSSALQLFKKTS